MAGDVKTAEQKLCEWARAVKLAKHYRAIGQHEIYLSREDMERPWSFVTKVDPGGTVRLGQPISVQFEAYHPRSKLGFRWYVDLEPPEANGTGSLAIDLALCRKVVAKLPEKAADEFRGCISALAKSYRKQAEDYRAHADRSITQAVNLERL